MNIKQEETAGYTKNIFMFEFPTENFSGIDYNQYSKSLPCAMNNLMWRILITKKKAEDISKDPKAKDSLGIYLECMGKSKSWSCFALVRFTLISQNPDVGKNISSEFKHLFSAVSVSRGYHSFISWDKVCNIEYGYINNDMVRIQAYVEADLSQNIRTLDYDMQQPQSFNDWLSLFENELNDKIVRRMSEEFKTVNEKMKSIGKLSEEIKGLNVTIERVHNRGMKMMSEFFIECLKVVLASFHSKMDSLNLENVHPEMVSVLAELQRLKSMGNEDKANEESRNENEENSSSESKSESDTEGTEESEASSERQEETEADCEIVEGKAPDTINISSSESSESDDDENSSENAPCEDTEKNEVVPQPVVTEENTAISALNIIKTLFSEYETWVSESQRNQRLGCGFRIFDGHKEVIGHTSVKVGSAFRHCLAQAHPKCCGLSSQLNCSCSLATVEPKCSKRRLENDDCSRSSARTHSPKKSKCLKKDTVKDVSDDDSDDGTSTSSSSESKSSQSSSTDEETSQEKLSK